MSLIDIISFTLLSIFGISYILKLIILSKKNNINANVFGKGIKPKMVLFIEKGLKTITFIGIAIWIANVFFPLFVEKWFVKIYEYTLASYLGIAFTLIGVLFFILAMVFMKTSWRAGIDKSTKTAIITSGLYKYSRNPAFVGMNFMFIGTAITYLNLTTIITVVLILVGLHLQILQEEKHMEETFGKEYRDYVLRTPRYIFINYYR